MHATWLKDRSTSLTPFVCHCSLPVYCCYYGSYRCNNHDKNGLFAILSDHIWMVGRCAKLSANDWLVSLVSIL